jgi:hypothetical protein
VRGAVLLCSIAAGVIVGCGDQPKPNCITSPYSSYATKLIERSREESTDGICDMFGPANFNADPEVGYLTYYARDKKGQPNYDMGSLGIKSIELGTLLVNAQGYDQDNTATDGNVYSLGPYSVKEPNDQNMCPVPTLSLTHLVLAELPAVPDDPSTDDTDESFPGQPAVDISLDWSNVLVYVTAASFGTQAQADLVDTRVTPDGETCTVHYRAVSLSPAIPCMALDDDGTPLMNDDGSFRLDESACSPFADPSKQRFTGSGIAPNTKYTCDPVSAYCVLDSETVPSLL